MTTRLPVLALALVLSPVHGGAQDGAAATVAPAAAVQGDAAGQADAAVRKTLAAALEVTRSGKPRDEQLVALRAVAGDMLDTEAMGRRALGDVLPKQPPAQQAEFLALFDQVMVRAYLQRLLLFREPRFEFGKPRSQGDTVIVDSRIVTAKDAYGVEYEMRQRDGRWVATDVIVEGISLTDNYRDQFASLLRDRSFAELLDLMRRKMRPARGEPE